MHKCQYHTPGIIPGPGTQVTITDRKSYLHVCTFSVTITCVKITDTGGMILIEMHY